MQLCKEHSITLAMAEIDICRDPSMDLLDPAVSERCLREMNEFRVGCGLGDASLQHFFERTLRAAGTSAPSITAVSFGLPMVV